MYLTSYHTHTTWSDGNDSLEAYLKAAHEEGLQELGISDHYVLCPDQQPVNWAMPSDALDSYVQQLIAVQHNYPDLLVRCGVEVDFFPENVSAMKTRLAPYPFDYIIGSIHYVHGFPVDENAVNWERLTVDERNDVWREYWRLQQLLAESGLCDIIAHLDLPKKFGFLPTIDLSEEIATALDAIAKTGLTIELNTAGWHKPVHEQYPSETILRQAQQRGIPLTITADAHIAAHLTQSFSTARSLALNCGFQQVVGYQQRKTFAIPLTA